MYIYIYNSWFLFPSSLQIWEGEILNASYLMKKYKKGKIRLEPFWEMLLLFFRVVVLSLRFTGDARNTEGGSGIPSGKPLDPLAAGAS